MVVFSLDPHSYLAASAYTPLDETVPPAKSRLLPSGSWLLATLQHDLRRPRLSRNPSSAPDVSPAHFVLIPQTSLSFRIIPPEVDSLSASPRAPLSNLAMQKIVRASFPPPSARFSQFRLFLRPSFPLSLFSPLLLFFGVCFESWVCICRPPLEQITPPFPRRAKSLLFPMSWA